VTHYGVTAADVERILAASADALRETTVTPAASVGAAAARTNAAPATAMER
jgi:hypothetical protein